MVFHMKATLVIPDPIFRKLKQAAAARGETISGLASALLLQGLREARPASRPALRPLPRFHTGRPKVDIADREALYRAMEEES